MQWCYKIIFAKVRFKKWLQIGIARCVCFFIWFFSSINWRFGKFYCSYYIIFCVFEVVALKVLWSILTFYSAPSDVNNFSIPAQLQYIGGVDVKRWSAPYKTIQPLRAGKWFSRWMAAAEPRHVPRPMYTFKSFLSKINCNWGFFVKFNFFELFCK